jgi:hypothetical protein
LLFNRHSKAYVDALDEERLAALLAGLERASSSTGRPARPLADRAADRQQLPAVAGLRLAAGERG